MRAIPIDMNRVRYLYQEQRLTCAQIGARFGVGAKTVHTWLVQHGIPRRKRGPVAGSTRRSKRAEEAEE